jgi:ribonuclease HI
MISEGHDVIAYIDGACKGNPGIGGWGVRIEFENGSDELYGGETETTNNRMELRAAIEALKRCVLFNSPLIYTDSEYVYKGITEWVKDWERKGWKNSKGEPVKNTDLWRSLHSINKVSHASWRWVKGHAACPGNNRADILANRGAYSLLVNEKSQ